MQKEPQFSIKAKQNQQFVKHCQQCEWTYNFYTIALGGTKTTSTSATMFQPSLQHRLWHGGLRPLMPRVLDVHSPSTISRYGGVPKWGYPQFSGVFGSIINHPAMGFPIYGNSRPAKACKSNIPLLGFDVCYHFQGKANVLWRSPDHVTRSCSFLAWQSGVCCCSIWGFAVFVFNKVCTIGSLWVEATCDESFHATEQWSVDAMQRKLVRPLINNCQWNTPQSYPTHPIWRFP